MKKNKKRLKSFSSFFLFFRLFFFIFFITCLSLSLIFLPKPPPLPKKVEAVVGELNISAGSGTAIQNVRKLGVGGTITNDSTAALYVNGNVGIGLTAPTAKLHVSSGGTTPAAVGGTQIIAQNSASDQQSRIGIISATNSQAVLDFGNASKQDVGGIIYDNNTNALWFKTNSTDRQMVISSAGNVGIGTTEPAVKLHVFGEGNTFQVSDDDNTGLIIDPWSNTDNNVNIDPLTAGGSFYFGRDTSLNSLIIQSGNVGIGTTGPEAKLDVRGQGRFVSDVSASEYNKQLSIEAPNTTTPARIWFKGTDNRARIQMIPVAGGVETGAKLMLQTRTTSGGINTGLVIDETGNVGIGTTAPVAKLDVAGAIYQSASDPTTILFHDVNESGTPNLDGFRIRYDGNFYGTNTDALILEKTDGNGADPDGGISFVNTGNDGVQEPALTIRGSGNVGIGTTSPGYKLDVSEGNVRISGNLGVLTNPSDGALINASTTYYTVDGDRYGILANHTISDTDEILTANRSYFGTYTYTISNFNSVGSYSQYINGIFAFARYNGTSTTLNSSYARGIYAAAQNYNTGTLPSAYGVYGLVHNNSTGTITNAYAGFFDTYLPSGTITNSYGVYISNIDGTNTWGLYQSSSDDKNYFAGNVGIGTTAPAYRLELPNNANASGQGRANAWVTYSDIRFKENITPITNALDKINNLQGVYFDWKQNGKHDIGFIAQEVEKVLPEVVSTDSLGIKSLDYARLTALLTQGIKEQQTQIASQSIRFALLEKDLSLTSTGDLNIAQTQNGDYQVQNSQTGDIITRLSAFAEIIVGKIKAGLIETKKLIVDGVDILKKLNELSAKVESQQKEIEGLKEEIKKLREKL